jgi:hypothetical protein
MSVPSNVANAGNNSSAQNVFRVVFSQALSASPSLEAWDDSTFSSNTKEMFTGTAGNGGIPYVSAVATTDTAPTPLWKPVAPVGGGAVANRLKGTTNFVTLTTTIPGVGAAVRFNLDWEISFDTTVPSTTTCNGVLAVRYSYSGAAPTLTWQFNDVSAGGTESSPQWTGITPGAAGQFIRPTDSGVSSANLVFTKPSAGVLDSAQIWVSNT